MRRTKQLLSVLLALTLLLCALPMGMSAIAYSSGDFEYDILADGTVIITGYSGTAATLVIPAKIAGQPVTRIGGTAFNYCSFLTSVTIPDSVTRIGDCAFQGCASLTSVTIPGSVTYIGEGTFWSCAFYDCASLTDIFVSDGSATYTDIDGVLFNKDKTTLIQYPAGKSPANYTIPDSVTRIRTDAFYNCLSLTGITIPGSVTRIGSGAFSNRPALTGITIPDSVTSIGRCVFDNCTSLTDIFVSDGNSNYVDIDGVLFSKDQTTLIQYPAGKSPANYTIPDSVTEIEGNAFYACESLTDIFVSDGNAHYADIDGVLFDKDQPP